MQITDSVAVQPEHITSQQADSFVVGQTTESLTRIYEEQINLVALERELTTEVTEFCRQLAKSKPNFNLRSAIPHEASIDSLNSTLPDLPGKFEFVEDLALLIDMYACLFDLGEVGLRMQVLNRAMCPRFHTDKLGCRLVTTYLGTGTEWLPNHGLDRTKLGRGSNGLPDADTGLYLTESCIRQVTAGDIVLLKGEGWHGNEDFGAVHRSPAVEAGENRVVVTMDFA